MVATALAGFDWQKWAALTLAVAMHLVLAAFLFFSVHWKNPPPAAIEVELVRAPSAPEAPPPPPPLTRPQPRVEAPPPKPPAVPVPRPDIALKDRSRPKPAPKPVPVPVLPEDDSKKRREQDQRVIEERQADALAREMQQLENKKLNQQLERELARAQADAQAAAKNESAARAAADAQAAAAARGRLVAVYQDRIRGKIRGNIVRPPELRGNPVARFDVTQLPSGEILDVVMTASSGNRAWDDAVERAIRKSSPLPRPDAADVHQRLLHLTFCPDEERGCR